MNRKYYADFNEELITIEHKSGLKVFFVPKIQHAKTYAIFATNYGSIDRCFKTRKADEYTCVPDGIAHFLEHKLFEGKDGNAFEKYAKTGANANAYTSFDKTAYLFSCTDQLMDNLEILIDLVQNPYFTKENVQKEQGIIGQEIRMYDDDPDFRVLFNLLECLYFEHPAKVDIAGTVESIAKIDKDILNTCYDTFYSLGNMVLCIVGNVNVEQVLDLLDKTLKPAQAFEIDRLSYDEPCGIVKNYSEQKLAVATPLFHIGFKDNSGIFSGNQGLKNEYVTQILLEMIAGSSSDVYESLYNQGLINKNFSCEYMRYRDFGVSILAGESQQPKTVYDEILKAMQTTKVNFDNQRFERAKKVVYSRMIRQFNSTDDIANNLISCYFYNMNVFDSIEIFKSISQQDARSRLNSPFNSDDCALSVISAL